MTARDKAMELLINWHGELDAPTVELRMIESLLSELDNRDKELRELVELWDDDGGMSRIFADELQAILESKGA